MRWRDGHDNFGWLSILLHWIGAAAVITMLFVGDSIHTPGGDPDRTLRLHTTIGLGMYLLLWLRIVWRVKHRHPAPHAEQRNLLYALAKPFHYTLIAAVAVMLLTGPALAWSGGLPLRFGELQIPGPLPLDPGLFQILHSAHATAARVLGWGTLAHVLAVLVHAAIYKDGSFDKMLSPPSSSAGARDRA